jgi:hypothetical protein
VDVQIEESAGRLTLSPTTVPCGTVTFDVTDVDTTSARLLVSTDTLPGWSITPLLNPGGTATLTVQFPTTAVATCTAVQVGGDGVITTVGEGSLTIS